MEKFLPAGTRRQAALAIRFISVTVQRHNKIGSITTNGSSTSYNTTSDYRMKEGVSDMTGAITRLKSLQPKRFNFIDDPTEQSMVSSHMRHRHCAGSR